MSSAYVDTSCFTAIALRQSGWDAVERDVLAFEQTYSSNLLEAELRSVLKRERVPADPAALLGGMKWVVPTRPLTHEFRRVLDRGYLRGADLWHLACALYLAEEPKNLVFLTLDHRQLDIGRRLGFRIR